MIEESRTDRAFENLSAADALAKMLHENFKAQAHLDHPGELSQAAGESLAFALRSLIQSALADLERE